MHSLYALVVAPAKIFVLAAEAIVCPVGLGVVAHPGSHFSLDMPINLCTMARVLPVLGRDYAWWKML